MKIKIGDKMVEAEVIETEDADVAAFVETLPLAKKKYHKFKTVSLENDEFRKKVLVQALTSPDFKNSELVDRTIDCIGFYTDYTMCRGRILLRVILMDTDYNTYSTVSQGIARDICNLIDSGLEPEEDYPTKWKVVQKRNGAKSFYVLQIVKDDNNAKT